MLFEKYTTLLENQFKGRFEGVSIATVVITVNLFMIRMFNGTITFLCESVRLKVAQPLWEMFGYPGKNTMNSLSKI